MNICVYLRWKTYYLSGHITLMWYIPSPRVAQNALDSLLGGIKSFNFIYTHCPQVDEWKGRCLTSLCCLHSTRDGCFLSILCIVIKMCDLIGACCCYLICKRLFWCNRLSNAQYQPNNGCKL